MVQPEQHVIYRLIAGRGQGGPSYMYMEETYGEFDCHEWKLTTVEP